MRVITANRVLAGAELKAIDEGAVIVDGTRIRWVGREADLSADQYPSDTPIERLGDVTLMPGLIDAHVHLAFDGSPEPVARMLAESDTQQVALMLAGARELLSVGVTTARDLGARGYTDIVVRDAIANGTVRGPRMLTAGGPITTTGGHCWFMGAEADGVAEVRKMVRAHHRAGVDVIKLMSTGGNMTPGSAPWHAQFTLDELRAAVEEAHRLGKKVAAHAHGTEGIRRALEAGVDSLEHCSFQTPDGMGGADPELVERIAASEVYVSPTCNLRMPEFRALMPGREFALPELYRGGAKIIASTDSGINNTPHYGYVGGLVAMTEFGLPISEVLLSATSRSALAIGIGDETGQVSESYAADLIAVGGDPRQDLEALNDLRLVMTLGEDFTPDPIPAIEPLSLDSFPTAMLGALDHGHAEAQSVGAEG